MTVDIQEMQATVDAWVPARLTAGEKALREAARLEAARVYGGLCREHRQPAGLAATVAEAEVTVRRRNPPKPTPPVLDPRIVAAIRDGLTNSEIIDVYGVDYATVRTARRAYMAGAA